MSWRFRIGSWRGPRFRPLAAGIIGWLLGLGLVGGPVWSQTTGEGLERTLTEVDPLSWSKQRLDEGLEDLSRLYEVPLWRDRRIDPTRVLEITTPAEPLIVRLQAIAEACDASVAVLPSCVYLGPTETAERLAAWTHIQREQLAAFSREDRRRLGRDRTLTWPRLAEPRTLVQDHAREFGVQVLNPERIPYDVWAAGSYPEMDLAESLTLLLAGFDLAFTWETPGRTIRIVELPAQFRLEESYRVPTGKTPPLESWQQRFGEADFRRQGNRLEVAGPGPAHRAVQLWLLEQRTSNRTASRPGTEKRLTLKIQAATLEQAVDYLGDQLQLRFELSADAQAKLQERVSVDVEQATLDDLLTELFQPLNLVFRIDEQTVKVEALP